MIVVTSRARTLVGRLREHFGGAWRYEPRLGRWRHEDGWHVHCCVQLTQGEHAGVTQYRRSDTHELIMGLDDRANPCLARWKGGML